jgi:hypothetical protein
MYKFTTEVFGVCIAHPRRPSGVGVIDLEIIEIQTFHGFRTTISTYRYERNLPSSTRLNQPTDAALCRHAIAQFLQDNGTVHVARAEVLDMRLPTFKGKLAPMGEKVNTPPRPLFGAPPYWF